MTSLAAKHTTEFVGLDTLAYVNSEPQISASIKQQFDDFCVDEELGFDFDGEGEHLYVRVQKTDLSTTDVAKRLGSITGVDDTGIGYAGMKDRRAVCTQWFSVQLPAEQERVLSTIEDQSLAILETQRNSRKLKIGSHKLNHFKLRLRDCEGGAEAFESRLRSIVSSGIPNYFGQQRFGRDLGNLFQVQAFMEQVLASDSGNGKLAARGAGQRFKRGMLYSAARSYLFNQLLSSRLRSGSWNKYMQGDVLNLNGTDRSFVVKPPAEWDEVLERRLGEFDIHITGPLAGLIDPKDKYVSRGQAADIEDAVLKEFPTLVQGLERCGLVMARRALRFVPANLSWQWESDCDLCLSFSLSRGCYATSLLRELCSINSFEFKSR